jgi:hypothetical protein
MNLLLGIDDAFLREVNAAERTGYKIVNFLFIGTTLLSVVANAYFGYLMFRTWWGVAMIAALMGFIQFSILRISLITLMTKPLVEKKSPEVDSSFTTTTKIISRFSEAIRFSSVLRFVFTGLIALSISVPLTILAFHNEAMKEEELFRQQLTHNLSIQMSEISLRATEINEANYPLAIIKFSCSRPGFITLSILFMVLIFSPLVTLARLRYNNSNKYPDLCREAMRKEILIDYQESIEQSQYFLTRNFPDFKTRLEDLSPFADMPFRQQKKGASADRYGSTEEFQQFIRTL